MKNSKSKRILFIMFFPVVFVLIMLTIGLPQQLLTAATVGTEKFKVTDFNFYYYEAYYSFVNENYNRLGDIGLNIEKKLKSQQYDAEHSWRDHFRDEALDDMQEYQILNAEADKAGFDASDEVESVRAEKAETIRNACIAANITDENKYLSKLYDGGMTEKIFKITQGRRSIRPPMWWSPWSSLPRTAPAARRKSASGKTQRPMPRPFRPGRSRTAAAWRPTLHWPAGTAI